MKGVLSYFIRSYRVTFLIALALAVFGISALSTLPRESTPEIEVPFAAVVTVFPGAAARDIEELVTIPIEEDLLDLEGVEEITSSSRQSISSVNVEFSADENKDEALRRLREAVDRITDLPTDAETPEVIEINFSDEPIIQIGLSGINDERLLTIFAEDIADEIENVSGVASVDVVGGRQEQISVRVDPVTLSERGLTLGQLLGTLATSNLNAPLGQVDTNQFHYDVRLTGQFEDISDVANTPIRLSSGETILLKEIAEVTLELPDASSSARISIDSKPSTPGVTIQVRKKTGGNIINIVDTVIEEVEVIATERLPEAVEVSTFSDRADDIRSSLRDVTRSGLQTFVIVFLLLWVFLGWKEAAIASTAVPFTFFISFVVFQITDISLNNVSLFSLILSLGLLVDTAIVIVEGIHNKQHNGDLQEGASQVVNQFKKPLTAGVFTTVAAFFPMLLVSGIIGQFLGTIPIVLTATLLSSLFVALAILPAVATRVLMRWPIPDKERWFDIHFKKFRHWYTRFIQRALNSRRFQNQFITTLVILMVVGLSLPFTGLLNTGLFPEADIDFTLGNVTLPPGSTLAQTEAVMQRIEDDLRQIPEINSFSINSGSATTLDIGGAASNENLGSFFANLDKDRDRSSIAVGADLRERLKNITEADVEVIEISGGPPTGAPVELRLIGQDLDVLDEQSIRIMDELRTIEGAIEIDRSLENSAGEFNFSLNREEIARLGVSPQDVAQTLRTAVFGVEATSFLDENDDEIKVELAAEENTVRSIDQIESLEITTATGEKVSISKIATINLETSINTIRHTDGDRAVTVQANVSDGFNANAVSQELESRIPGLNLPVGYEARFGGEQQETEDTFNELYNSMFIAVIAILGILVIEFNSYRQPLIIIVSIPLALIGVLFGLLILQGQLNFASFIGLVSLTGIVVNNAILLVDRANTYYKQGSSAELAIERATDERLRPIILTTLTTAAGVAPLIFVDEFFKDLALTLITGLLFSTVLTLALIPILYVRQQKKIERKSQKKQHTGQQQQVVV